MNLWNVDSHSLPITLMQLLLRPGYLIGEYINGRRQVSFPPLNMLFTVAVGYVFIMYLFGVQNEDIQITINDASVFESVLQWLSAHPAWGMISVTMMLIVPTWVLFRFAQRNNRHTLPQSIFIQIFMSTLMFICLLLGQLCSWLLLLIPFYYYVTYRQLFGYGFWGTLWRLLLSVVIWFSTIVTIVLFLMIPSNNDKDSLKALLIACLCMLVFIVAILMAGYWISKFSARRQTRTGIGKSSNKQDNLT